jgi:hypothetical protein
MEATLAMASPGRFNPDGPHLERRLKNGEPTWFKDPGNRKIFPELCFIKFEGGADSDSV